MNRAQAEAPGADYRALTSLLRSRRSCRAFLAHAVPRATIVAMVEAAQRTASWCNTQPWRLIITSGAATERLRHALYQHAAGDPPSAAAPNSDLRWPREYRGIYLERRREAGFRLHAAIGIARGDKAARTLQLLENFRLFGAPHLALITTDEALGVYGAIDCGAFVSTFLLAAETCGVGAVAQASLARYSTFLHQYFALPEDRLIVCGVAFGFADRSSRINGFRTTRAGLEDVVSWVDDDAIESQREQAHDPQR